MHKCTEECNKYFKQLNISSDDEERDTQYTSAINVWLSIWKEHEKKKQKIWKVKNKIMIDTDKKDAYCNELSSGARNSIWTSATTFSASSYDKEIENNVNEDEINEDKVNENEFIL